MNAKKLLHHLGNCFIRSPFAGQRTDSSRSPLLPTTYYLPSTKSGFTIVEILIVAPIVILVIGIFVSTIVSMTGEVLATRAANTLAYNAQEALNLIEQDVKLSGAFLATNNITLQLGQGYDNDTTAFKNVGTNGTMLILNTYATTSNPLTASRDLVYASDQPNSCGSAAVNQNLPVMMNIVYFIKDSTLWRRVIAPSFYAMVGCSVPWQQPSCVPGYNPTTYPFCKTQDMRLVDGIASGGFNVEYFPSPSSATANAIASDSDQLDSARLAALQANSTVGVTITAANTTAGRAISQSGTIRAVSPNNNITTNTYTKVLTTIAGTGGTVSAGGTYNGGTTQTISATPNAYYEFGSWTGSTGCSGAASHTIVLDENKTCTANFTTNNTGDVFSYLQTLAAGDTTITTNYANIDLEMVVKSGNQTVSANDWWGSVTNDARMLGVRVEGNLTVNAGIQLSAAARKRGMAIYVTGDATINGTISMTARGANAAGQRVLLLNRGTEYEVPAAGAAGGAGYSHCCNTHYGYVGSAGTGRQTGGGGGGQLYADNSNTVVSGAGAYGTSYSGGAGGGAATANYLQCNASGSNGAANGGAGGSSSCWAGGGAGNNGGAGYNAGANGTGGLLILYVQGNLTFGTSGLISSGGSAGGSGNWPTGGGSGGGSVNVFYKGTLTGYAAGKLTADGGGGVGGGAGTTNINQSNF